MGQPIFTEEDSTVEIKEHLMYIGLKVSGRRSELLKRIEQYYAEK